MLFNIVEGLRTICTIHNTLCKEYCIWNLVLISPLWVTQRLIQHDFLSGHIPQVQDQMFGYVSRELYNVLQQKLQTRSAVYSSVKFMNFMNQHHEVQDYCCLCQIVISWTFSTEEWWSNSILFMVNHSLCIVLLTE